MAATARAVDLTNVKEGGNFRPKHKPEGDYKAKIVKADDHQPKDKSKAIGWVLTIQVEGDARSSYPYYLSPEANQAWKIRQVMVAAGFPAKSARIKFDPNKLVNRYVGVSLEDDEYEGRPKSTIGEMFPVSEVGANADEDAPEDDVENIDTDEDDVEIPEDDEPDDEPEPEPVKPVRRRKPAPEPEPEDDEDEEEPPAPVRKRRAVNPPAKKVAPKPAPPADDEDDDLDLDDLDD